MPLPWPRNDEKNHKNEERDLESLDIDPHPHPHPHSFLDSYSPSLLYPKKKNMLTGSSRGSSSNPMHWHSRSSHSHSRSRSSNRRSTRNEELWYVPPSERLRAITEHSPSSGNFGIGIGSGAFENDETRARAKRTKKLARKCCILAACGLVVIFCMDGMSLSSSSSSSSTSSSKDIVSGEEYAKPYMRRFARITDGRRMSAEGEQQEATYTDRFARINENGEEREGEEVEVEATELSTVENKQFNDHHQSIVNAIMTDASPQTSSSSLSSGLRRSPGSPLPSQHMRIEDYVKQYEPSTSALSRFQMKPHEISGLDCTLYGGPNEKINVYWRDVKVDDTYRPPFYHENQPDDHNDNAASNPTPPPRDSRSKYLTFEPVLGGLDYNRMAFELYLVLAAAMGRTLVLPPKQHYPYLDAGTEEQQILSMEDFFHLEEMNQEIMGVNIITMEEFLAREGVTGHLINNPMTEQYKTDHLTFHHDITYPPHNDTNWDVRDDSELSELWTYLRSVSHIATAWNNNCLVAFPSDANADGNGNGNARLTDLFQHIQRQYDGRPTPNPLDFQGRPVHHAAPPLERMREILAHRPNLCLYHEEQQDATVVHVPTTNEPGYKLLMQYYSFIFFEDPKQAMWSHRIVRDHLRYKDVMQCAASRVVRAIRAISMKHGKKGRFHSICLTKDVWDPESAFTTRAEEVEILNALSQQPLPIQPGGIIFVMGNAWQSSDYLQSLLEDYHVVTLSDFHNELLTDLNPNYDGAISQLIAAQAFTYHGTNPSSHCGYVTRLRGYYASRDKWGGHDDGRLLRTYSLQEGHANEYQIYKAVQRPFYAREFPISWRNIDADLTI